MEGKKKIGVRMPRRRHRPVKTERQTARSIVLTYFQGDINSMVDEHFSRALSKFRRPQGWPSSSHRENVIFRNYSTMFSNQWHFTSSWTKPQPESFYVNGASSSSSSSLDEYRRRAIDQYPLSMPKTPYAHPQNMWYFPSPSRPYFQQPAYSRVFPERYLAPEVYSQGRTGSLLQLLYQDRYLNRPLQPAIRENRNFVQIPGSSGLFMNLPPNAGQYKQICGYECACSFCNNARIQAAVRRDLYFY